MNGYGTSTNPIKMKGIDVWGKKPTFNSLDIRRSSSIFNPTKVTASNLGINKAGTAANKVSGISKFAQGAGVATSLYDLSKMGSKDAVGQAGSIATAAGSLGSAAATGGMLAGVGGALGAGLAMLTPLAPALLIAGGLASAFGKRTNPGRIR